MLLIFAVSWPGGGGAICMQYVCNMMQYVSMCTVHIMNVNIHVYIIILKLYISYSYIKFIHYATHSQECRIAGDS